METRANLAISREFNEITKALDTTNKRGPNSLPEAYAYNVVWERANAWLEDNESILSDHEKSQRIFGSGWQEAVSNLKRKRDKLGTRLEYFKHSDDWIYAAGGSDEGEQHRNDLRKPLLSPASRDSSSIISTLSSKRSFHKWGPTQRLLCLHLPFIVLILCTMVILAGVGYYMVWEKQVLSQWWFWGGLAIALGMIAITLAIMISQLCSKSSFKREKNLPEV